jgi:hypothetical protein
MAILAGDRVSAYLLPAAEPLSLDDALTPCGHNELRSHQSFPGARALVDRGALFAGEPLSLVAHSQ